MSTAARTAENLPQDTPIELIELQKVVDGLPSAQKIQLAPALDRVIESTARRRKILKLVQEALGQLRLDMKYLVFDLEATRRERDLYRDQVRHLNGEDNGPTEFDNDSGE